MNELQNIGISAELLPRIFGAMGLAQRAGKLITGSDLTEEAIRGKKAKLVLLANNVSDNTAKKLNNALTTYPTPHLNLPVSMEELAKVLGKKSLVAGAAITDAGFVAIITKLLDGNYTQNATNGGAATYGKHSKI